MLDANLTQQLKAYLANAHALRALHESGRTLDEIVWSHAPDATTVPAHRPMTWADVPATSPQSTALARELKSLGFRFVGPTTAYAGMQACGVVDDHLASCPVAVARDAGTARPVGERRR